MKIPWEQIVAVVGALAWLPTIIDYFKNPIIRGRIISQYGNVGSVPGGGLCSIILQKISVFSANRDFFLKDLDVYIKYPNSDEIKCTVWTWRNLEFSFDSNGKSVKKKLNINKNEYILHLTVLPKNQSIVGFVSFTISPIKDEKFEYIKYRFKDFKNNIKELKISKPEIIDSTQMFDDSIWV